MMNQGRTKKRGLVDRKKKVEDPSYFIAQGGSSVYGSLDDVF